MRKTMLEQAINGRPVICYVNGLVSPWAKNSNLYHAMVNHGYTPDDIGVKIGIAIGGRRGQSRRDGYHMAIVALDQPLA